VDAGQGEESGGAVPGQAGPTAAEVLGQLRTLLGPLLTDAEAEPASPPLPQRHPGQERPGIPRRQAGQAAGHAGEPAAEDSGEPAAGDSAGPPAGHSCEPATGPAAGHSCGPATESAGGLLAGDRDLLRLADNEEAWW
jgi:hypothetical protein